MQVYTESARQAAQTYIFILLNPGPLEKSSFKLFRVVDQIQAVAESPDKIALQVFQRFASGQQSHDDC